MRGRVQTFVQELLEEEVTQLLGWGKSERRAVVGPVDNTTIARLDLIWRASETGEV